MSAGTLLSGSPTITESNHLLQSALKWLAWRPPATVTMPLARKSAERTFVCS